MLPRPVIEIQKLYIQPPCVVQRTARQFLGGRGSQRIPGVLGFVILLTRAVLEMVAADKNRRRRGTFARRRDRSHCALRSAALPLVRSRTHRTARNTVAR